MRLNKFLAKSGVASRRESDRLIQAATTTVNGKVVIDPAYQVQPDDDVKFDGVILKVTTDIMVIALHKPKGVITTAKDTHGRRTVFDYVSVQERLFTVGRLDKDTTGLILLTNDGELANRLMHPRYRVPRVYEAIIAGSLDEKTVQKIRKGIFIGNDEWGKADILEQRRTKGRSTVHLRLRQGKKREIRRIFEFLNIRLFSLKRLSYGAIELGDLPIGLWRKLTPNEMAQIKH